MTEIVPLEGVVLCGKTAAQCRCGLQMDHEGPCTCAEDDCLGQWCYSASGQFVPVRMPFSGMLVPDEVIARLVAL